MSLRSASALGTERQFAGHTEAVLAVAITPDGTQIVTGGGDGTARIFDRATGREQAVLTGHTSRVKAVAITPDGTQIVTGGGDGTARIFDRATGREQAVLTGHTSRVKAVAITPDGLEIVTVGLDGSIRVWNRRTGVQVRGTGRGRVVTQVPLPGLRSDAPTEENLLGDDVAADVNQLAALAVASSTAPPLSIALLGSWGSGKSSFMLQMQARVRQLADLSRNNLGRSAFAGSVRQVRFNVWHYSDDQVWTGLVEELFQELARPEPYDLQAPVTPMEDRLARKDEVQRRLQARQADRNWLDDQLSKIRATHDPGWLAVLRLPVRLTRAGVAAAGQLQRDVRASLPLVALWLVVAAAAAVAWYRWAPQLRALGAAVAAVAGLIASLWTMLRKARDRVVSWSDRLERELRTRRDEVQRDVVMLRAELARLDAAARLNGTLQALGAPDRYQRYRGLIGQVHEDLRRLESDLADVRGEWDVSHANVPPPLERIVLYIDDLDRCPPRRVVEVLAAVNLLLALPLFVVVVAVDPRWLLRCLAYHQADLFESGREGGPSLAEPLAAPVEYLDKIFQVPYALRPLVASAADYLNQLLPTTAGSASTAAPGPSPSASGPRPSERPSSGDGDRRSSPTGQATAPSSVAQVIPDLQPASLQLDAREREFLLRLGPLVSTPRAGKKLINLYRLVRIGIADSELPEFVGGPDGGTHQPVLILLAVLVGRPALAGQLLAALRAGQPDEDIVAFLRAHAATVVREQSDPDQELADLIEQIRKDIVIRAELADYQRWVREVARYSFHALLA